MTIFRLKVNYNKLIFTLIFFHKFWFSIKKVPRPQSSRGLQSTYDNNRYCLINQNRRL